MKNTSFFCFSKYIGDKDLAVGVAKRFGKELSDIDWIDFADGEILIRPVDSVKGKDVVVIHSLYGNVNNSLVSLLIGLDSLKRSGAKSITLVFPYYFYSRQDRRAYYLDPIGSKVISECIVNSCIDRLILVELHSSYTLSFFDKSLYVEHLTTTKLIIDELSQKNIFNDLSSWAIVSPDYGGLNRAREFSDLLDIDLIIMDKRRVNGVCEIDLISGDANNKNCLIVDDMLDTGETIFSIANLLKKKGANQIFVTVIHALFSKGSLDKLSDLCNLGVIDKVFVTNSIPRDFSGYSFIETIDLSLSIAEAIGVN